jgi:hypothetical protein
MRSFLSAAAALAVIACGTPSAAPDAGSLVDGASDRLDGATSPSDAAGESDAPLDDAMRADGGPAARPLPIFGVTLVDPWSAGSGTLASRLRGLEHVPSGRLAVARVVFDEGVDRVFLRDGNQASDYVDPVTAIRADARVMGELLDSFFVPGYSVDQYRARACEYRATLGHLVDLWEIGNEVNGEWLSNDGEAASVVADKLVAAVEVFEADGATFEALCPGFSLRADERPFEIALTAYENGPVVGDSCWASADHSMAPWLREHFGPGGHAASIASAIDYLLVSYYEDDCESLQPNWQAVFDELGTIFPDALLGFGECGTEITSSKRAMIERYYHGIDSSDPALANMHVDHPRFVGGYFWWWFQNDMDDATLYEGFTSALTEPFWDR